MNKRIICCVVALLLVLSCFSACGSKKDETTIYVLNWGEYLEPTLVERFEKENPDIKVKITNTTTNEEMYTVCSTEGTKIDMLIPSDYMIERMINEGLLAELDFSSMPNFQYVEDVAKDCAFDPEMKYSVPYMMGTLGIVYNTKLVDDEVDSWELLWSEKYAGSIMMYDSIRDSMAVALRKLGYSINTTDKAEVEAAGEELKAQKPIVYAYLTDEIKTSMASGTVALAVDYSGAAVAAIMENEDLEYVVPKEGSNIWVDSCVVLKSSPNKEACERFINFLCDPEVAAINSEYIGYTTPNNEAIKLMGEEYLNCSAYVIADDVRARCEFYKDLGDDLSLYNDVWMKVRTAS